MPNGYDPNATTADQRRPLAPQDTGKLHRNICGISGTDVVGCEPSEWFELPVREADDIDDTALSERTEQVMFSQQFHSLEEIARSNYPRYVDPADPFPERAAREARIARELELLLEERRLAKPPRPWMPRVGFLRRLFLALART